ncbi:protein of unknown function [Bradyrhizobium vignae]|uniref:Uncharacterized protein n=1 Tax=Bradyrhizobium vignae TaxID=1549949 RepID=A0A2U3PTJ9_9BRAD|nr:protein of unknown function [Bradyrhizobium vignae]
MTSASPRSLRREVGYSPYGKLSPHRHCERSEAIQNPFAAGLWICFVARAPRNDGERACPP